MSPTFDRFVAVDWSGAKGPVYSGIALAECGPGDNAPVLIQPPGKTWRRVDFANWLIARAGIGDRLLVGIDCAFALPAEIGGVILGEDRSAAALWSHIDGLCGDEEDFYGGDFIDHAQNTPLFWRKGPRPAEFKEHHRATELACRAAGLGAPESPLKLIGAKQVGKGGLAGMRVLSELKRRLDENFAVWPFEPTGAARVVCVELYPRLFLRMAGYGNRKVRTLSDLDSCLAALGSDSYKLHDAIFSDHETDALIASAGLRHVAGTESVWMPLGLDARAQRSEGWIFGVP